MKSERLEGTGKGLGQIKVRRMENIDEVGFSKLIREAAERVVRGPRK